eukprot:3010577-Rhodomonas_salina.4
MSLRFESIVGLLRAGLTGITFGITDPAVATGTDSATAPGSRGREVRPISRVTTDEMRERLRRRGVLSLSRLGSDRAEEMAEVSCSEISERSKSDVFEARRTTGRWSGMTGSNSGLGAR